MPAFGDALTDEQIEGLVHYLWSLCSDKQWPRGDLNFPRAILGRLTKEGFLVLTHRGTMKFLSWWRNRRVS